MSPLESPPWFRVGELLHNGIPQLIRHVTDGAKPIVAGGVDKDIHSTPLLFDQVEGVLEVARGSRITWKRKPYSPRWRISLTVASATPVSLRKPSMDEPMSNTATRTSSSAKASRDGPSNSTACAGDNGYFS